MQAASKAPGKEKKKKAAAAAGLLALEEPAVSLATASAAADAGDDACFQARLGGTQRKWLFIVGCRGKRGLVRASLASWLS